MYPMPQHDHPVEREPHGAVERRSRFLLRARQGPARPRLLVVDDEPLVGRMLSHAASECGFEPALAADMAGFRREYEAATPEVVLLDLSLRGGDGVELMRFLAEKKSKALVLIVSGFDQRVVEAAERLGKALGLRVGGCLTKPIFVKELADAIEAGRTTIASKREPDHGHACL
jgi:DNA-binding response OmpR family regulator